MYERELSEYTNPHKMEETTAKVFARLHQMKAILYKSIKKTSCGIIPISTRTSSSSRRSYYCNRQSEPIETLLTDDTISSISVGSTDSGVSTLSNISDNSSLSSTILLNQTATTIPKACPLRCDPSIINYISYNLLTTYRSELFLDEIDDQNTNKTPTEQVPLAESSRRLLYDDEDSDRTMIFNDEDDRNGPLTSTLIDRWYSVTKSYSATFREDLSVRKNELIQILRSTHPHWSWVRNEQNYEGFIPTDCLIIS